MILKKRPGPLFLCSDTFYSFVPSSKARYFLKKTKEKIISSALKLFNKQGMVNVRLQHIADEAFMSIGNMAYHYKNKEAIVLAIHEGFEVEQKALMAEMNVVPLFDYVDQYFRKSFDLQQQYSFLFTDMLEVFRAYEPIASAHSNLIKWQKQQFRLMLEFNQNRGAFERFPFEGQLDMVVNQLWMASYMYFAYQLISGCKPEKNDYCQQVWTVFIPLMTERGQTEYKQFRSLMSH